MMTLGELSFQEAAAEPAREEYIRRQARLAVEKAAGKAEHRFMPEPGKNVCKICGKPYGQGNHTPMKETFGKSNSKETR
jgi:hypothetical protein